MRKFIGLIEECFEYAESLNTRASNYLKENEPIWWKIPGYIMMVFLLIIFVPILLIFYYIPMVIIGAVAKIIVRITKKE